MEFKEAILSADFQKAKEIASHKNMDAESLMDNLFLIAYEEGSMAAYGFANQLILEEETSEHHYLASFLLSMGLTHFEGAYPTAFYHAKRAAELSPEDLSYKEYLLFFHILPDPLLSREEAIDIAGQILEVEPDNDSALEVLNQKK
ncbi:hypothetical protein J9317_03660 [Metabacillus sp. KIGAM252]|uniref:Tetratricopeptide repeat protein n=1 Tax=Metabacillus flavus TaxID=2823519 RepID=A0ABS5LAW3_9BACI|nr:hypothetical protein [Metabacillus flavus]MBS2967871.1 hypothetical protein [Metabacillus flavus]